VSACASEASTKGGEGALGVGDGAAVAAAAAPCSRLTHHLPYFVFADVAFAAPRLHTHHLYFGLLLVTWSCSGAGYFLSLQFKSKAQLACTIYPLLCTMLSGMNPTLPDLSLPAYWLSALSYSRWSVNLFWLLQAERYDTDVFTGIEGTSEKHGYDRCAVPLCAFMLFLIGAVARGAAFLQLRSLKRAHSEKVHHK
jgi:hypothetical protein